jgi:uncharacterized protein (DUF58 family)
VSPLAGKPRRARRVPNLPPSATAGEVATKAVVLRRLELDVTRRLDGMLGGDYRTAQMGLGSEPSGAREYGPGDDARHIDWNLSARALTPHVRTTEADRELETWVIADRSPSLDFGTAQREKREVVLAVIAAFGFLTVRSGNRLGVVIAGGQRLSRLPARAGKRALFAALARVYDTPREGSGPPPEADITAALAGLAAVQARRSQVVVASDFLDTSDWVTPMRRLSNRHQVIAVHVVDPRELELPHVGILSVIDAETGRRLDVQTDSPVLRARYAAAASSRQAQIRSSIRGAGAEYLRLSTDRDWLPEIAKFAGGRRPAVGQQLPRSARPLGPVGAR